MTKFKREVITSFERYEWAKNRFPKREIIPDAYSDDVYYFGRHGHVRRLKKDGSIWVQVWEDGFPTLWQQKVRQTRMVHGT